MKKKRRKLNKKRIFVVFLIIALALYLYMKYNYLLVDLMSNGSNIDISNINSVSNYKIIKQDNNSDYSGIGRQTVKNKDGYFATFTTIDNNKKTYKEYKQNGNSSWSEKEYWGGTMAESGCGITVMSIILSGYNKNYTPEDLRKKYYPVINYDNLSNELFSTFGIKNSDFYYDSTHLSNKNITEHLKTNRPIIICVWNKPSNNRWTTASHYMALLASDDNGKVYVSNPNRWRK